MSETKFDALANILKENTHYALNSKGNKLLVELDKQYRHLVKCIHESPILGDADAWEFAHEAATRILSDVSAKEIGNSKFMLAMRLSNLTHGGKNLIDSNSVTINADDEIFKYLETVDNGGK